MIGFMLAAALMSAPVSKSLQTTINGLAASGDSAHANVVTEALRSSPELIRQYEALANAGLLKGLIIKTTPGRFGASHQEGIISITTTFLDQQTPISGDHDQTLENIVFILGYEAAKVKSEPNILAADKKQQEAMAAVAASTPSGSSIDATGFIKAAIQIHLTDEARAYLQGWNDEIDAATLRKGGPLTPAEVFQLLRTSRNLKPILAAATLPEDRRIEPDARFLFPQNERNIKAVVSTVTQAMVPDFN